MPSPYERAQEMQYAPLRSMMPLDVRRERKPLPSERKAIAERKNEIRERTRYWAKSLRRIEGAQAADEMKRLLMEGKPIPPALHRKVQRFMARKRWNTR